MKILLAIRLLRVFLHLCEALLVCALLLPWVGSARRHARIRSWSRRLLGIFNVSLETDGAAHAHVLVVANHVSWLDIFVINALHPCSFVAKSEIRDWPLLGWLATQAGTVFIARGSRRALRTTFQGIVESLQRGERVAFFPQGTTATQGAPLAFHANLFEAAIDAGVMVQPYALEYLDRDGALHPSVDYIGDMSFAGSMQAILAGGAVRARLRCLPAFDTRGAHRRELAASAALAVAQALGQTNKNTHPDPSPHPDATPSA